MAEKLLIAEHQPIGQLSVSNGNSWEKLSTGVPPTSAYGAADETDEKLQYAFRIIMDAHRAKSTTNENEIRALRQTVEELKQSNQNLVKKLQAAEREIMEQQHRLQMVVKDNEALVLTNRVLNQKCEKYRRLQQTFSEALENSGHEEDSYVPPGGTSVSGGSFSAAAAVEYRPKFGSNAGSTTNPPVSAGVPNSSYIPTNTSAVTTQPIGAYTSNTSSIGVTSSSGLISATNTSNNGPTGSSLTSTSPPKMSSNVNSNSTSFDSSGKDGKQFFRVARTRLQFEAFNTFLGVIKKLNAHELSRDGAVEEAKKIFGPENQDLIGDFQSLISRHQSAPSAGASAIGGSSS